MSGVGWGWGVREGGRGHMYPWPVHVDAWKNHHNILITLNFKKGNVPEE